MLSTFTRNAVHLTLLYTTVYLDGPRASFSGFNGCCTAMWKANGVTITLVLFKDSIMDLREIGWDGVHWIDMAQDRGQWRALVNTVLNLRVP
jgi:hypothetical protein